MTRNKRELAVAGFQLAAKTLAVALCSNCVDDREVVAFAQQHVVKHLMRQSTEIGERKPKKP